MTCGETPRLDHRDVERYRTEGYLIVRGVFQAEEIAVLAFESQMLAERHDLIDTANLRCRWQDHAVTGECMFDCFDPVIDISSICRAFASDRRISTILAALLDDEPHLFKDKLIFKRPGSGGYGLHQDFIGWSDFPESFTTVIVAIDPTDAGNGATEVFAGCHRQGYLSPRDGDYHELPLAAVGKSHGVMLVLEPGDVAIFSGFTPHRSGANRSDRWRRQLYFSYNAGRDGGARREAPLSPIPRVAERKVRPTRPHERLFQIASKSARRVARCFQQEIGMTTVQSARFGWLRRGGADAIGTRLSRQLRELLFQPLVTAVQVIDPPHDRVPLGGEPPGSARRSATDRMPSPSRGEPFDAMHHGAGAATLDPRPGESTRRCA